MEEENTQDSTGSNAPLITAIVLIASVLLGIGFFALRGSKKTIEPTQTTNTSVPTATVAVAPPISSTSASPSPSNVVTPTTKTITITGENFSFSPNKISAKLGDTIKIVFTNRGGTHDFVIDEFNVRTKRISSGESDTVTIVASKKGTFEYYCSVGTHRAMGTVGKLIVE